MLQTMFTCSLQWMEDGGVIYTPPVTVWQYCPRHREHNTPYILDDSKTRKGNQMNGVVRIRNNKLLLGMRNLFRIFHIYIFLVFALF